MKLWRLLEAKAKKYRAAGVMINGDLLDKYVVDGVTLSETTKCVAELAAEVPVYILGGNHEASSVRGGRFNVEALAELPGVTVFSRPGLTSIGPKWLDIYACPFAAIEENRASVNAMRQSLKSKRKNVLLFHNSVVGCRHLAWVCDDGIGADELCEGWDDVIAGHFHTRQKFGACGRYLGAPMQHSFGDRDDRRGIYAVKFTKDASTKFTFIPSEQPEFHVIENSWKVGDVDGLARKGDYVRFEIESTSSEWKIIEPEAAATVETLKSRGVHAQYRHKPIYHHTVRVASSDAMEGMSGPELISGYVDSPEVVVGDLDIEILKTLGRELYEEASAEQ
jgi:DNA repair exonuclease SbcCD nuclease subunit